MITRKLFRWVGPFWDTFLTKWDLPLKTDVTVLKLALVAIWFATSNFSQGTTVAEQSHPRHVVDFWTDVAYYLLLGLGFSVYLN